MKAKYKSKKETKAHYKQNWQQHEKFEEKNYIRPYKI